MDGSRCDVMVRRKDATLERDVTRKEEDSSRRKSVSGTPTRANHEFAATSDRCQTLSSQVLALFCGFKRRVRMIRRPVHAALTSYTSVAALAGTSELTSVAALIVAAMFLTLSSSCCSSVVRMQNLDHTMKKLHLRHFKVFANLASSVKSEKSGHRVQAELGASGDRISDPRGWMQSASLTMDVPISCCLGRSLQMRVKSTLQAARWEMQVRRARSLRDDEAARLPFRRLIIEPCGSIFISTLISKLYWISKAENALESQLKTVSDMKK